MSLSILYLLIYKLFHYDMTPPLKKNCKYATELNILKLIRQVQKIYEANIRTDQIEYQLTLNLK